ncbi:MAG: hypothetical protein R3C01_06860 [Planctomycetaceae bacterium]
MRELNFGVRFDLATFALLAITVLLLKNQILEDRFTRESTIVNLDTPPINSSVPKVIHPEGDFNPS